jgi:hypothetical protein
MAPEKARAVPISLAEKPNPPLAIELAVNIGNSSI